MDVMDKEELVNSVISDMVIVQRMKMEPVVVNFAREFVGCHTQVNKDYLQLICESFLYGYGRGKHDAVVTIYGRKICPVCDEPGIRIKTECHCEAFAEVEVELG